MQILSIFDRLLKRKDLQFIFNPEYVRKSSTRYDDSYDVLSTEEEETNGVLENMDVIEKNVISASTFHPFYVKKSDTKY
jgi:hypothetical protein